ncbi:MAG: hypothetical protein ACI8X5_002294 [Planctomycetota bacterium]|jgi:hypothetical protein
MTSSKNTATSNENSVDETAVTQSTPECSTEESPKAKKPTPTKPDEMGDDLIEFITAIDEYKRVHSRPFPSWGEVFDVLKELGYERP